jgi:hypothetical protein
LTLQGKTDVLPGRPTLVHHNDPEMCLLRHYEKNRAYPPSKLHIWTLPSGGQQTRNYYKEHGPEFTDRRARELYAEISEVEDVATRWCALSAHRRSAARPHTTARCSSS